MNGPGEAAGLAFFKLYGIKVGLGMIGAALLYFVLPPVTKDGRFDAREFVLRLTCAGLFSVLFGDWVAQLMIEHLPWLHAENHRSAVDLMVGAPGWWISRAIALWFQKRRDKDIVELASDAKDAT